MYSPTSQEWAQSAPLFHLVFLLLLNLPTSLQLKHKNRNCDNAPVNCSITRKHRVPLVSTLCENHPVALTFMQRNIRIQVPKYVVEFLLRHDREFQHRIVIGLSKNVTIKIYSNLPSPKADNLNMRGCITCRKDMK